jgi:hypothetical protein
VTGPCVVSKSIEELVEGKVEDGMGFEVPILSCLGAAALHSNGRHDACPQTAGGRGNQNNGDPSASDDLL